MAETIESSLKSSVAVLPPFRCLSPLFRSELSSSSVSSGPTKFDCTEGPLLSTKFSLVIEMMTYDLLQEDYFAHFKVILEDCDRFKVKIYSRSMTSSAGR